VSTHVAHQLRRPSLNHDNALTLCQHIFRPYATLLKHWLSRHSDGHSSDLTTRPTYPGRLLQGPWSCCRCFIYRDHWHIIQGECPVLSTVASNIDNPKLQSNTTGHLGSQSKSITRSCRSLVYTPPKQQNIRLSHLRDRLLLLQPLHLLPSARIRPPKVVPKHTTRCRNHLPRDFVSLACLLLLPSQSYRQLQLCITLHHPQDHLERTPPI